MRGLFSSLCLLMSLFFVVFCVNYGYMSLSDDHRDESQNVTLMKRTMGSMLIVFGTLKLLNLRHFVGIFSKYDVISQRVPYYGYTYPFVEIALGVSIMSGWSHYPYYIVIGLMMISVLGVLPTLYKGKSLRCGCMGSLFHIPLSYVTISENVGMMVMAGYLLSQP